MDANRLTLNSFLVLGGAYLVHRFFFSSSKRVELKSEAICGPWPFERLDYFINGRKRVQEAYSKHASTSGSFAIPYGQNTMVMVTGEQIRELTLAAEDHLSFDDYVEEIFQFRYTLGPSFAHKQHYLNILRQYMPRGTHTAVPEILEEVAPALELLLDINPDQGWVKIKAKEILFKAASGIGGRAMIGLPTCRVPEYRDLLADFATQIYVASTLISLFPSAVQPVIGPLFSPAKRAVKVLAKYVGPMIAERQHQDPASRPSDLVSWIMNYAETCGIQMSPDEFCRQMLASSVVSIHTTGTSLTHAVYYLAAERLKYLEPLRAEIEDAVRKYGWTRAAMDRMKLLDSFLKESQRLNGLSFVLTRVAKRDFMFSDGTVIPQGFYVGVSAHCMHRDETIYDNASQFDGYRFYSSDSDKTAPSMHSGHSNDQAAPSMHSTSLDYLAFGHGVHKCVGRVIGSYIVKATMAHLIMHYDLRMENEGVRPNEIWIGGRAAPNPMAEVMFKRRD